jgi:UDP-2,3-diacylglucosamine hydrolase
LHRIYISDLHLSDESEPQFATLAALLRHEAPRADAIFILGDLCEAWVGDDDDSPLATALRAALKYAGEQTSLHVMRGNRDFLLGERFAAEIGCCLVEDPCLIDPDTLIAHGDAFCIDDGAYQAMRRVLRSEAWQQDVLARPLEERRGLAAQMREQSRLSNANKAENIMDVSADEVDRTVKEYGARRLIHGHTHRPGVHPGDWGTRYVLGSWEHCGWLLREQDTVTALECFPLSGRYGT